MFLYELALQLGARSTDLVERARSMGMDVGPSSFLTPEQVSALRHGVAPPGVSAPTAPPPPAGPPAPVGAPPSPTLPMPGAAAPPGAVPPPPPAPGPVPMGPSFVAPSNFGAYPPGPNGPHGQPMAPGMPPPGGSQSSKTSPGFVVAVVAIVAVAVVVCGFLFLGTTSDDEPEAAPAERSATATQTSTSTTVTAPPPEFSPSDEATADLVAGEVVDVGSFCRSSQDIMDLEMAVMEQGMNTDMSSIVAAIDEHRDGWEDGVDGLLSSTTGSLQEDVDRYASGYRWMFDVFAEIADGDPSRTTELQRRLPSLQIVGGRINSAISDRCL